MADWDDGWKLKVSVSGGSSDVVNDTSPQLGGQLDVNGFALGDGTLELLKFAETALAVNELTITNAAAGNAPVLSATGDDTNIDLKLSMKGTGKFHSYNPSTTDGYFAQFENAFAGGTTRTLGFYVNTNAIGIGSVTSHKLGFFVNNGSNIVEIGGTVVTTTNGSLSRNAPVTKTGDFTVADSENWLIVNKGSTCTVTLPDAATYTGREVMFNVITAHTVVSASSNVVPRAGGAASTAILAAAAGNWAALVSDGTNWKIMAGS
jgi:hypothetical protein